MHTLTKRDWDRIEEAVSYLREKRLRESRYGERPEAYNQLLEKIRSIKEEAQ